MLQWSNVERVPLKQCILCSACVVVAMAKIYEYKPADRKRAKGVASLIYGRSEARKLGFSQIATYCLDFWLAAWS